ncbi:hypothetical protein CTAM01_14438 [Colletotrichum tamarilloi]|uniref:Clr5 domain-containing protein n=1 Tax=Colletotrichum tamarilloi TaxID=1209934 RepID=A0ABQ9QP97_9PEZI|nr:uncharacterized protein CTAM01_14438 [Colletotrichum tamarilloi]KAK1480391.1 hypothetical protein CTAM01_14438 [Colletotrichum tamarilloi]
MDAPIAYGPPRQVTFHDVLFEKRWDYLKDIIVQAFLGDATSSPLTLDKLSDFMKEQHGFNALPAHYRYRLRQWHIRKNTKKVEKTAAITALGKRNRVGGNTSDVKIRQGESMMPMDSKQMKRFIKDSIRHHSVPSLIPGITISDWLHDYWMYCFVTAKFWGTGPQEWTARMVAEFTLGSPTDGTPQNSHSPLARISGQSPPGSRSAEGPRPTQICRWAIHQSDLVEYEPLPSTPREEQADFDLGDQSSWTEWPDSRRSQSYQSSIHETFINNRFSTTAPEEVPIACEVVSEVISTSDMPLALDSLAFAIMAGNIELISKTLSEMRLSAKTWRLDFTVLRSHTNLSPAEVSTSSVQAVCHSMMAMFLPSSRPNINTVSGLFRRRCTSCGLEMKLGPLHTLVAVAFHLAENGKSGETLFGALACLVCLLVLGADPAQVADLSVLDIFSSPDEEQHEQFMKFSFESNLCDRFNNDEDRGETSNESDSSSLHDEWGECPLFEAHDLIGLPRVNQNLGVLWATIQTELLTYRKVNVDDAAISDHFQLSSLLRWLEGGSDTFETPLLTNGMMESHNPCGWFNELESSFVVTASDVCSEYFMNMDIWSRASFIEEMIIE